MADPLYLGVNELGIQVWEIEEGGMRPLLSNVDKGWIKCEWCGEVKLPTRIGLTRGRRDVEWVVLACPDCGMAHCVMRVKLYRSTADVPKLTPEQIDSLTAIHPEVTGGKLHYTDPKAKVKAGIEVAVESLQKDKRLAGDG